MNIINEWQDIADEMTLRKKDHLILPRLVVLLIHHVHKIENQILELQRIINEQKQTDGTSEEAE